MYFHCEVQLWKEGSAAAVFCAWSILYYSCSPFVRSNLQERFIPTCVWSDLEQFWCTRASYLSLQPVIRQRRRLMRISCCCIAILGNATCAEAIRNARTLWHGSLESSGHQLYDEEIVPSAGNNLHISLVEFMQLSLTVGFSEKHLCLNTAATTKWAQTLQHQCHVEVGTHSMHDANNLHCVNVLDFCIR